ncbi:hypothetical protein TNCV_544751 [Trichonephila clavipes]|nr:hypothetical protein TNCV_544751 [Trichonephila clavipes]
MPMLRTMVQRRIQKQQLTNWAESILWKDYSTKGTLNYDQKLSGRSESRDSRNYVLEDSWIGVYETFRSAPSAARLPGGIFQNAENSMQCHC